MLLNDEIFEDSDDEFDSGEKIENTDNDNACAGKKYGWIYGMRHRMRELLALPAPECNERNYLIELGVPVEHIDNCMLVIGVLFRLAVEGNIRAFQELRHIVGDNETNLDRRIKLAQLNKTKMQIEDIRRKNCENEKDKEENSNLLAEILEESAASLWQNGGDLSLGEQ